MERNLFVSGGSAFTYSFSHYNPNHVLPWHSHDKARICLVLNGEVREQHRHATWSCSSSDIFFNPEGEPHENRFGGHGARVLTLSFNADRLSQLYCLDSFLTQPICVRSDVALWLGARIEEELQSAESLSTLILDGLSLELLGETVRSARQFERRVPNWLQRVRESLHDEMAHRHSLRQLASSLGVHPIHLARSFRRHFGVTVGQYLRRIRIESAARQLAEFERSIAEIALDCGFYDQSHFTKTFKRVTGLSPKKYRERFHRHPH